MNKARHARARCGGGRRSYLVGEGLHQGLLGLGVRVEEGLLEQDDARDVLLDALGGEEELAVLAAVGLGVLNLDVLEAGRNRARGLVSSQDALAGDGNRSLRGKK